MIFSKPIKESNDNYSSTDYEEENNSNTGKRQRFQTDYEDIIERSNERQNIEIAIDGTVWKKSKMFLSWETTNTHPTGHAKRNIMKGEVRTAFYFPFDNRIMEHMIKCTEVVAQRVLGK